MKINLRKANKHDIPAILELITELAEYERAVREVTIDLTQLETDGFGSNPLFEVILAENGEGIAGMAFWFYAYSTWKGKCIYLEDIIVKNELRGQGIGTLLFEAVIARASEVNAKRLMWQVLDWNEPAIAFYKKYKPDFSNEWLNVRMNEFQIEELSQKIISNAAN